MRLELFHRPTELRLFLETCVLWTCLALFALLPAWVTLRLLAARQRRRRGPDAELSPLAPAQILGAWMVVPVVLHATLDRHTGLYGNLDSFLAVQPWLEACGVLLALGVLFLLFHLLALLARRITVGPLAVALLALSSLAGSFLPWRAESAALAGSDGTRPNLLLLVWDTTRADRLQPYGYERETTPHLARLAEESVLFEDSRSVSCFTFTSHLSMLTGVRPSTHGARLLSTRYDPRRATSIAETLREAGYRTGAFVGTDVLAGRTGIRRGFDVYDDRVDPPVCDTRGWKMVHDVQAVLARLLPGLGNNGQPHWFQDFQRPATEVLDRAAAWIDDDDPRPWFCMVNLYDVHWPYLPTSTACARLVRPYAGPLDGYLFRSDRYTRGFEMGEEDARHISDLYDAELFELDAQVDAFLGEIDLAAGGTAVVMTSDHGEAFGEAGRWKHEDITEPQVRVPLIVRLPEPAPSARRVTEPTSGIDVAPTLLRLAGLEVPGDVQGLDLLGGELPAGRALLVEDRDRMDPRDVRIAYYSGPWKLLRAGLGEEAVFELYDLRVDPVGEIDVSAAHPEERVRLIAEMIALRGDAEEEDLDVGEELRGQADALRALGYAGDDFDDED